MLTSATIDITAYTNTTETSSAKSNNDKSSGFGDVFDNVNKAFNSEKSNSAISDTKNQSEQKVQQKDSSSTSDKKVETEDKTIENKIKNTETKTETEKVQDKDGQNTTAEDSQETDSTNEVSDKSQSDVKQTDAEIINQPTILTNNLLEILENTVSTTLTSTLNTGNDLKGQADAAVADQVIATEGQLENVTNLNTDLTKLTQNLTNGIANQASGNKVAANAKLNSNAEALQQNIQPQGLDQQAVATDSSNQIKIDAEAVTKETNPILVAVQANVKIDENTNASDKDALSKTALTQDMIDKTNARITGIDTNSSSSANSNNLFGKQNAQEQAIKFYLEGNTKSPSKTVINTELPNISDTTSQLNFSKTLDAVQPQETKEISQSDILAQINKQIDGLKDAGTTKVTIILRPENLGKISLELVNSKEGLTAKMTTENSQVKELLDKSLNSLKDTLGSQGVSVNNVSVKLNETQKQDTAFSFNEQTNQQQQQNSNNHNQTNGSEFSFDKEMNSATEAETETVETSANIGSESSVSIDSSTGKVDYKV